MIAERTNLIADGHTLKRMLSAGLEWLDRNHQRVNRLNVYPVPDGDTGTNMLLTMRAAYRAIAEVDEAHVGRVSRMLADGALYGSRGNSGTILSQLWKGVAEALDGHATLDAPLLARASQQAVEAAYKAVPDPVEGTILTVARAIMEAVVARAAHEPDLIALLKRMVFAGRRALRRTPELLPILKKAGVVDSGGQGLVYLFEGMLLALCRGASLDAAPFASDDGALDYGVERSRFPDAITPLDILAPEDAAGYGYDVQFLMHGDGLNLAEVRRDIEAMGWSALVVGDARRIKVHVHVHDPGVPLSYAIARGASLDDIVVENMQRQYQQFVRDHPAIDDTPVCRDDVTGTAVIAVANGAGMRRILADQLGAACVISGGQSMNPSTGELLDAIRQLPNEDVIVLPNNKNIILTAEQAAALATDKRVRVVPSVTLPQGIAAMLEYDNLRLDGVPTLDNTVEVMTAALEHVTTIEIARATRDVDLSEAETRLRVRGGQWIAMLDGDLAAADDALAQTLLDALRQANATVRERITLYYGDSIREPEAGALLETLRSAFPNQELELVAGGQALYPYLVAVE